MRVKSNNIFIPSCILLVVKNRAIASYLATVAKKLLSIHYEVIRCIIMKPHKLHIINDYALAIRLMPSTCYLNYE